MFIMFTYGIQFRILPLTLGIFEFKNKFESLKAGLHKYFPQNIPQILF